MSVNEVALVNFPCAPTYRTLARSAGRVTHTGFWEWDPPPFRLLY